VQITALFLESMQKNQEFQKQIFDMMKENVGTINSHSNNTTMTTTNTNTNTNTEPNIINETNRIRALLHNNTVGRDAPQGVFRTLNQRLIWYSRSVQLRMLLAVGLTNQAI
jgi:hypothetical protein